MQKESNWNSEGFITYLDELGKKLGFWLLIGSIFISLDPSEQNAMQQIQYFSPQKKAWLYIINNWAQQYKYVTEFTTLTLLSLIELIVKIILVLEYSPNISIKFYDV